VLLQYYSYEANSISGNTGPHYLAVVTTKVKSPRPEADAASMLSVPPNCDCTAEDLVCAAVAQHLYLVCAQQGELLYLLTIAASEAQWKKSKSKLKKVAESFTV